MYTTAIKSIRESISCFLKIYYYKIIIKKKKEPHFGRLVITDHLTFEVTRYTFKTSSNQETSFQIIDMAHVIHQN